MLNNNNKYRWCGRLWSDVVSAVDELDIVVVEAERTTQDHVKTERVAGELQQAWKWPICTTDTRDYYHYY